MICKSYFYVSYEVRLIQSQQYLLAEHQVQSFVLNVSVCQHILVVSVQNPAKHLPIYLVLFVYLGVVFVDTEELDHVEASFWLIQRISKNSQSFIVMLGWKDGQIPIKHLNNKFRNIGGLSFLLFWFFNKEGQYPIEWLDELLGVEYYLLGSELLGFVRRSRAYLKGQMIWTIIFL